MSLNDTQIRNAKAREQPYKIADGNGLVLLVNPSGSKWWRFRYRIDGKEKMLSLGVYPDVPLKKARERRDVARQQVADDVDPSMQRKAQKSANVNTLEAVGREWFKKHLPSWAQSHSEKVIARLENFVFPHLGSRPIAKIEAPDVLACLRRIESRGTLETAHRTMQNCSAVFRYAVATGRTARNPCSDLKGALPPVKHEHFPTILEPVRIGGLLKAIDAYHGSPVVRAALRLAPLTFVRPGELRGAQWREFNIDEKEWRVPAERMKMRVVHIVPLSRQAVEVLRELEPLSGDGRFVFPSPRGPSRPLSDNALNAALRYLGYEKGTMTTHGFRSMASTLLNEQQWNRDAIERQLAHAERDDVRGAYNFAEFLPERRKMMQHWADYLDGLRVGNVVNIKRSA